MLSPDRHQALIKPKHTLKRKPGTVMFERVHAGFYEERDVQGTAIHWEWLLSKWTALADKLEAEERRGVYGPRNR